MPLRRKNMDGLVNEYELQQQAQIARNKQHLESLNIPTLSNVVHAFFETLMAAVVLSFIENLSCTH